MRLNRQLACLQAAVRRSVRSREFQRELIGFEMEARRDGDCLESEVEKTRS